MRYLALYRKYRPENFDDVVGQSKVVNVIKNEISNNRISHAYLFSGPRGTGKTTTAKIIAKMVNCENLVDGECCNKCSNCMNFKNNNDIVEIDAASNNGVDEIRELRDKINLVPSNSKYKVYIIDEVHMLTTQAFNALLKTLEEPPAHVIFILATTELHKVPLTVSSRCQKFQFSKISNDEIVLRLKTILEKENMVIDDDVLSEIARLSDGGMRDAINMLDQLIAYKGADIKLNDVYEIGGYVSYIDLYNFINYIYNNDISNIVNFIENIDNKGKSISKFIEELIVFLKDILLKKNANIDCEIKEKESKIVELSSIIDESCIYDMIYIYNDTINNIKNSNNSVILFVISTLKIIDRDFKKKNDDADLIKYNSIHNCGDYNKNSDVSFKQENLEQVSSDVDADFNKCLVTKEIEDKVNIRINNTFVYANKNELNEMKKIWIKINDYLLDKNYSLNCGILKDCSVVAVGDKYLILTSKYETTVNKINLKMENIEKTLSSIFNKNYYIVALTEDRWNKEKKQYAINIKNGKKYIFAEYNKSNLTDEKKNPVDELIDIVGEDLVEIKKRG